MRRSRERRRVFVCMGLVLLLAGCAGSGTKRATADLSQAAQAPQRPAAATASPSGTDSKTLESAFADGQPNDSRLATSVVLQGALALAPPPSTSAPTVSPSQALNTAVSVMPGIANDPGQSIRSGLWSQAPPGQATIPGQSDVQHLCWLILSPSIQAARHGGVPQPGQTLATDSLVMMDYLSVVDAASGASDGTYAFSR